MVKVADFGTSRFLEIAAHGTTVIGSPPYMAPEQFHGKAVFASDIYSLGVTMYQMLTGDAALRHAGAGGSGQADVRRAGVAAAAQEPAHSKADQRHRHARDGAGSHRPVSARARTACRPDGRARRARSPAARRPAASRSRNPAAAAVSKDDAHGIQTRLRARETPAARFCWQCRKPLHARTDKCPFCGEAQ